MSASFAPFAAKMREAGLPERGDPAASAQPSSELVSRRDGARSRAREIDAGRRAPESAADLARLERGRRAALARTVVIKLNGGLGTTMGMTRAKSLLPVKDGLTLPRRDRAPGAAPARAHGVAVPLVLHEQLPHARRHARRARELPGSRRRRSRSTSCSTRCRASRAADLTPVGWPRGSGARVVPARPRRPLPRARRLGRARRDARRRLPHAFVSNADNLGAVARPRACSAGSPVERLPFAMEVKRAHEADKKGGHLARAASGRLVLREMAQCPADELASFQDVELYRYFNTNNLWVDLRGARRRARASARACCRCR